MKVVSPTVVTMPLPQWLVANKKSSRFDTRRCAQCFLQREDLFTVDGTIVAHLIASPLLTIYLLRKRLVLLISHNLRIFTVRNF